MKTIHYALAVLILASGCQKDNDPAARVVDQGVDQAVDAAGIDLDAALPIDAALLVDALPLDMAVDAHPRSLADLWSPDFGPPPDDMPEAIRWMHGRMWCDSPRPPRTLSDGSSECAYVDVPTPIEEQTDQPIDEDTIGCTVWPHRTSTLPGAPGGATGVDTYVACSPDLSLCCSYIGFGQPIPCGWTFCDGMVRYFDGYEWTEELGLAVSTVHPAGVCTPEIIEAFPHALNNCHPICKAPACPDP